MPGNSFINRLLLLIAILAPIFWLVMSTEGQRISDIFFLSLGGDPELRLNYEALHPMVSEAQLHTDFPDIEFTCERRQTSFGDLICHSAITDINGIPARYVTFFFAGDHLTTAKLIYRRNYHELLRQQLDAAYGSPGTMEGETRALASWKVGGGTLVMVKEPLTENDEPALLWLGGHLN